MRRFGWISKKYELPWQWDLRRFGWTLRECVSSTCTQCRHVLLIDAREQDDEEGLPLSGREWWTRRLLMLGVDDSARRASLLVRGYADVAPRDITLEEIEARATRIRNNFEMLPRLREVGPLTLDLFHRDAWLDNNRLGLHPREFGLLWRLSDEPGARVTRSALLRDVWRIFHEPETNSVEVHVSRLRSKLAGVGCGQLIETAAEGGYRLINNRPIMFAPSLANDKQLDIYLRQIACSRATGPSTKGPDTIGIDAAGANKENL